MTKSVEQLAKEYASKHGRSGLGGTDDSYTDHYHGFLAGYAAASEEKDYGCHDCDHLIFDKNTEIQKLRTELAEARETIKDRCTCCHDICNATIEANSIELKELSRDSERLKWLIENNHRFGEWTEGFGVESCNFESCDFEIPKSFFKNPIEAIDAAMKGKE